VRAKGAKPLRGLRCEGVAGTRRDTHTRAGFFQERHHLIIWIYGSTYVRRPKKVEKLIQSPLAPPHGLAPETDAVQIQPKVDDAGRWKNAKASGNN
jgi:hypothetical protein